MNAILCNPNTFYNSHIIFQNLTETIYYITNSRISLFLDTIVATGITTRDNGGFLSFQSNQNLSIQKICCHDFTSQGTSIYFYVYTTNTANASYISLDTSISLGCTFGAFFTAAYLSYVNTSFIKSDSSPGVFLYGTSSKTSNLAFYSVANCHSNGDQITESTNGQQTWENINIVNNSCSVSMFKNYIANVILKNTVFTGNWNPSGGKPRIIWGDGVTVMLENVVIQANGTLSGSAQNYITSENPNTIVMIVPDQWYCKVKLRDQYACEKTIRSMLFCILYQFSQNFLI